MTLGSCARPGSRVAETGHCDDYNLVGLFLAQKNVATATQGSIFRPFLKRIIDSSSFDSPLSEASLKGLLTDISNERSLI